MLFPKTKQASDKQYTLFLLALIMPSFRNFSSSLMLQTSSCLLPNQRQFGKLVAWKLQKLNNNHHDRKLRVAVQKTEHGLLKGMEYRHFSFGRRSTIFMMPEGPEVRCLIDQLHAGAIGKRLVDITFVSGRYVRHGRPDSFHTFAKTMTQYSNNLKEEQAQVKQNSSFDRNMSTADEDTDIFFKTINSGATGDDHETYTYDTNNGNNNAMVDIILDWNCKGKFIYILLDNGRQPLRNNNPDYQRSIWITLGMTGKFLSEKAYLELKHQQPDNMNNHNIRWIIRLADVTSSENPTKLFNIYYQDPREFGTLKFCTSKQELLDKLSIQLGPDILNSKFTVDDFLTIIKSTRPDMNICKFCMNQSKISGVGNYILAESLYRANIDPFCALSELSLVQIRILFNELQAVATESYNSLRKKYNIGTRDHIEDNKSTFEMQCYGRQFCFRRGEPVIRETNGPHGRTIWYTNHQLFISRKEREDIKKNKLKVLQNGRLDENQAPQSLPRHMELSKILPSVSSLQSPMEKNKDLALSNDEKAKLFKQRKTNDKIPDMIESSDQSRKTKTSTPKLNIESYMLSITSGLKEPGWRKVLQKEFESEYFYNLMEFLENEERRHIVYPPRECIFTALNLCPLESVKVVVIGQDPYHGQGQAHGLAFSVKRNVPVPPSLQNIIREAIHDVGIEHPNHGNLEAWAKQGVLLLNTVLTVRHGEPNSHANKGWEQFTDAIVHQVHNYHASTGIVYLIWGNAAAKKVNSLTNAISEYTPTSHPSPLGAGKTKSPFLGSECFSQANRALDSMGKAIINWNIMS